mgnify:FL=1
MYYLWITRVQILETVIDAGLSLWTSRGANIVEIWVGMMNGLQCKDIGDERFRINMAYIRSVVYIFSY